MNTRELHFNPSSDGRVKTPPVAPYDPIGMDEPSAYGCEIITIWKDVVLKVSMLDPMQKKSSSFLIGEGSGCEFPIPEAALEGLQRMPLVTAHAQGRFSVCLVQNPRGDISYEDGRRVSLAELVASGQAEPSVGFLGLRSMGLPSGARIKMDIGEFTFLICSVPSSQKIKASYKVNFGNQRFTGVAFFMHALVLLLAFFDPGNLFGMSADDSEDTSRLVKYDLSPFEKKALEETQDSVDKASSGQGKRHKDEEGQLGKRDAVKTTNKYGVKGPLDNRNPVLAREMAKQMASEQGILQFIPTNVPTSPFGAAVPLGMDPENALGALNGDQFGDNFGYGGLGMRGTGRGGGGDGSGTIGMGRLNTIGHCVGKYCGGGAGSGYGLGKGDLGGHRPTGPNIRSGAVMATGSLSKDLIRRIVHRHINEVRFCYERELVKRPDMSGRVSIKFIISGTGAVQSSAVADSTLGNVAVESCIRQAVQRWAFPQPQGGGVVIVTYPFQLESSGV